MKAKSAASSQRYGGRFGAVWDGCFSRLSEIFTRENDTVFSWEVEEGVRG